MPLDGKKILIGISGGIAAYKTQVLVRMLIAAGSQVRVVMTPAAQQFVTPTTLEALTRHRVYLDIFEPSDEFPVLHVGLADWADLLLIAPATAHTIAKLAHGQADDLLAAVALSTRVPLVLAPAMEQNMLEHPAVVENLESLRGRGAETVEPGFGALASGKTGKGRMAEPEGYRCPGSRFVGTSDRSQGAQAAGNRWTNGRGHRSRTFHFQPLQWQDGVRYCPRGGQQGCRGVARKRSHLSATASRSYIAAGALCRGDARRE